MAWPVVGRAFTPAEFEEYVRGLTWAGPFRPQFIVLHNTASPSLAQRPDGLTRAHIANLEAYYKSKGWNGGPHLFIDDRRIWVFNDLTKRGTHSPSWNGVAIGIEMLGDFDKESFTEGRGRAVRDNTVAAVACLNKALGFPADGFKFHIEDTRSDHACPGKRALVARQALIAEIAAAMEGRRPALVADAEESHIDTKAIDLAEAETVAAPGVPGVTERVRKLNELADQGSRLAQMVRRIKQWLWGAGTIATGSGVTLANTNSKSAGILAEIVREHPFLTVAIVGAVVGVGAYVVVKLIEKYIITAATDGRYRPRGG